MDSLGATAVTSPVWVVTSVPSSKSSSVSSASVSPSVPVGFDGHGVDEIDVILLVLSGIDLLDSTHLNDGLVIDTDARSNHRVRVALILEAPAPGAEM